MKAIIHKKYGPPEVAKLKDIPKPIVKENCVLVKVKASTVNRTDSGFRSAQYFISRFWSGLFRPKHQILGCEFSGTISAVGSKVSLCEIGDKVFGYNDKTFGGHAEYICLNETDLFTTVPKNLSIEESAAILEGAHYALVNIRAAKVKPGDNVMVYGASGAIGSAAVQILKHFGAHITAVCNSKNVNLVKSLGAHEVIDYQTQDYTNTKNQFNFIFDAVGKSSFGICKPLLINKGIYISTELGKNGENLFYALFTALLGNKKLLFPIPSITKEDVLFIKELVENGTYKPLIDRTYPLNQITEAYTYVEAGQKTGNVLLLIENYTE